MVPLRNKVDLVTCSVLIALILNVPVTAPPAYSLMVMVPLPPESPVENIPDALGVLLIYSAKLTKLVPNVDVCGVTPLVRMVSVSNPLVAVMTK